MRELIKPREHCSEYSAAWISDLFCCYYCKCYFIPFPNYMNTQWKPTKYIRNCLRYLGDASNPKSLINYVLVAFVSDGFVTLEGETLHGVWFKPPDPPVSRWWGHTADWLAGLIDAWALRSVSGLGWLQQSWLAQDNVDSFLYLFYQWVNTRMCSWQWRRDESSSDHMQVPFSYPLWSFSNISLVTSTHLVISEPVGMNTNKLQRGCRHDKY